MDLDEYVVARLSTLLRTAVLLGCPPDEAAAVVARVLASSARRIARAEDPDPLVYDALVAAIPGAPASRLAALDPVRRQETVMAAPALEVDALVLEPPPPPPPPAWQLGAALVALVALLVAAAIVGPGAARVVPTGVLGAAQVPSLFGYDGEAAADLLRDRGIRVVEQPVRTCELGGRVLDTDPPVGSPIRRGNTVVLRTAVPSGPACDSQFLLRTLAWHLVDFATGRGPAPDFAPQVRLLVVGADAVVLTGAQAARPRAWGRRSALVAIAEAASEVVRDGASYVVPELNVYVGVPPLTTCGSSRPFFAGDRPAVTLTIGLPGDQVDADSASSCPMTLSLYRTEGAIDGVVLYAPTAPEL